MKKYALMLVCGVLALSLFGCAHQHKWTEATCTAAKVCADCKETEGEPLGHTTGFGICERCGEALGKEAFEKSFDAFEAGLKQAKIASDARYKALKLEQAAGGSLEASLISYGATADSVVDNIQYYAIPHFKKAAEACEDIEELADWKAYLQDCIEQAPTTLAAYDIESINAFDNQFIAFSETIEGGSDTLNAVIEVYETMS